MINTVSKGCLTQCLSVIRWHHSQVCPLWLCCDRLVVSVHFKESWGGQKTWTSHSGPLLNHQTFLYSTSSHSLLGFVWGVGEGRIQVSSPNLAKVLLEKRTVWEWLGWRGENWKLAVIGRVFWNSLSYWSINPFTACWCHHGKPKLPSLQTCWFRRSCVDCIFNQQLPGSNTFTMLVSSAVVQWDIKHRKTSFWLQWALKMCKFTTNSKLLQM
jgi:hypothetical protein